MKKLLVVTLAIVSMAAQSFAAIKASELKSEAEKLKTELSKQSEADVNKQIEDMVAKAFKKENVKTNDIVGVMKLLEEIRPEDKMSIISLMMKAGEVDQGSVNLKAAGLQVTKALIDASKFSGAERADAINILKPLVGATKVLFENAAEDSAALNKLAHQIYTFNQAVVAKNKGENIDLNELSYKAFVKLLATDKNKSEKDLREEFKKWKDECGA